MHNINYAYFFDFHTSPTMTEIGSHFQAEELAERLARCGIDFITFPARCNMGMAYYETNIGIKHYGLNFDLFGELVAACQRRNIAVCAYFNGGISQEETHVHPEWQCHPMTTMPMGTVNPFLRTTCMNTPYRTHLMAMIREVAEHYPVAGFFVDCMGQSTCQCESCLELMQKHHVDALNPQENKTFIRQSVLQAANEIAQMLRTLNKEYLLYFNDIGYEEQLGIGNYLDFECIPTKTGSDYEYLPLMSRYMRTLPVKQCINMTGRFHRWGDFGGLRPKAAIQQELLTGLANGMRPDIGDHLLPHGDICEAPLEQAQQIYRFLQQREPYFENATPMADIAICFPKSHQDIRNAIELRGAARMLCELHGQFDIVSAVADWNQYKLLILPDSVTLTEKLAKKLRNYLKTGKHIIASGDSGRIGNEDFLPEWPVDYVGNCPFDPCFFRGPKMAHSIYASGIQMSLREQATQASTLVKPAVNHIWDGLYPQHYNPPEHDTKWPFLAYNHQIAHFSHRIFSGYKTYSSIQLRNVFEDILNTMLPAPLFSSKTLPRFTRVTMTQQKHLKRVIIHILAHIPESRALNGDIIEEDLIVPECDISVLTTCTEAFLEPEGRKLKSYRQGERLLITLPQFSGYALIMLQ